MNRANKTRLETALTVTLNANSEAASRGPSGLADVTCIRNRRQYHSVHISHGEGLPAQVTAAAPQ